MSDARNTLPEYPDDDTALHKTTLIDDVPPYNEGDLSGTKSGGQMGWGKPEAAQAETAVGTVDEDDEYEYVRVDGKVRAIRKDQINDAPVTSKQDASALTVAADVPELQFYVHLANGDVERVAESDLPVPAGTNHAQGIWTKDGKAYQVIGVYPVEDNVKGEK